VSSYLIPSHFKKQSAMEKCTEGEVEVNFW